MPAESTFATAVKSSLEALLTDLHNTTEVLKRAHLSNHRDEPAEEPIYEPQQARVTQMSAYSARTTAPHGNLDDLEQLLNDYPAQSERPTVESLLGELDNAVEKNPGTAAGDLDNLMASLSEYPKGDGEYATPAKSPVNGAGGNGNLDDMLGSLSNDMSKHGISTIPKGDCAGCTKTIVGQVIIALGKMWHPECFVCGNCGEELGHRNFFERAGRAYCENDYHNLFSPRCAYCNGPIKDKCVTALDKTWHPECFSCAECGKDFGEDGFHERDNRAYCRRCFFTHFAPKCRGCQRPIQNNFITALNTQWHPECFVCQDCNRTFEGGSFFEHGGAPYCEQHYHHKKGSLCAGCKKPISGRCVTAMNRKFHPEHFVCSFCLNQLTKGTFKEHESKPYCHKCFEKLLS